MLKNKIIVKKIRNIFVLLMAIIIMIGAYHNIRNSRAENVIQIELEVIDKSGNLSAETIIADATETTDGNYLLNLPISVNKNIVIKYYTSSGEEIEVDAENNITILQLTEQEVEEKKVQIQTDYDTKEVTVNGETTLFYKKELTNEPVTEEQEENSNQEETTTTTENSVQQNEDAQSENQEQTDSEEQEDIKQDVIVTGYMPLDARLEVKEIDMAELTNVKLPNDEQTIQKAYELSIYQLVEKQTTESVNSNTTNDATENSTTSETTESNSTEVENIEYERIEYNPSEYGETITVKTIYEQNNIIATIYTLGENNELTQVEETTVKAVAEQEINLDQNGIAQISLDQNNEEQSTNNAEQTNDSEEDTKYEAISFETEKTEETTKYVVAVETQSLELEENSDEITNQENSGDQTNEITSNENSGDEYSIATTAISGSADTVKPVWSISGTPTMTGNVITATVVATDVNFTGILNGKLTTDKITVYVDSEDVTSSVTKTLTGPTYSGTTLTYTLKLDVSNIITTKSGTIKIKIAAGSAVDGGMKASDLFEADAEKATSTNKLHVGDFISYDAGTWTTSEINSIKVGKAGDLQTPTSGEPTNGFQFGGITNGTSRNGAASVYESSTYSYIKDKSTSSAVTGWRVFDIDGDEVVLISAADVESYYYVTGAGYKSEYVLTGNINSNWTSSEAANYTIRNWEHYVKSNQFATTASVLTKDHLDLWYSKYIGGSNTATVSTLQKIYDSGKQQYQNVVDNYSYYWLATPHSKNSLYNFGPKGRKVVNASGKGIYLRNTFTCNIKRRRSIFCR